MSRTKVFDWLRLATTALNGLGIDSERIARALGTKFKHAHRTRSLLRLKNFSTVDLQAILRAFGGLVSNYYTNLGDADAYNTEYYENLRGNLYSLCARGTENYSVRFYETFCMGRIPVLVDTDVVLPFEGEIDYDRSCVIVAKRQVHRIDRVIKRYHASKSDAEMRETQLYNRQIWERYFSSDGYFQEFVRYSRFASTESPG